ncbi:MAG: pseudouridine-5'-phosphate glycosidase [Armatimonadota bacterium]|nr:pseudouridine-5'-phosphate glycosidase [Armatimonadota bacterium]MDR7426836.1 pseudouridine-5'-phosphate glycosidase [Armatimonadota bacterium]MDR7468783.1 pseudouridine-5'-phosphate glycosidase [Armatimonadota bacterium]MDR7473696.1 pseudouridine-5'-phosphate glycosidase [Armatimonadota bacterium]MDR7538610.1 pseudouridine-5'-phosphate glycosidase [Armatimonadota bacterium]
MMVHSPFDVSDEIQVALGLGGAVVALESAVITHGLPAPANLEAAVRVERAVRAHGAVPAMVALIGGRVRVGLRQDDLAHLAVHGVVKVGRRDLAVAMARQASGGTTVSATLAVAHALGLRVQATGGIGGVHAGAAHTWDVSADLDELSRRPLVLVCSGAKAICDIAATLEALETRGVTVLGYRTTRFPSFYVADSGHPVPWSADSVDEIAAIARARERLGETSALLVANPPPAPWALPAEEVADAVARATARAEAEGIRGGELTPYLLHEVDRLTGGRAVEANLALLEANAALAAEIAVALTEERLPA